MMDRLRIIGGGLAGCEAAWQAAHLGAQVTLYEMRPHVSTGAHRTANFAELVCSNSLRSISLENAIGLAQRRDGSAWLPHRCGGARDCSSCRRSIGGRSREILRLC